VPSEHPQGVPRSIAYLKGCLLAPTWHPMQLLAAGGLLVGAWSSGCAFPGFRRTGERVAPAAPRFSFFLSSYMGCTITFHKLLSFTNSFMIY
jgi:hypothetical protein